MNMGDWSNNLTHSATAIAILSALVGAVSALVLRFRSGEKRNMGLRVDYSLRTTDGAQTPRRNLGEEQVKIRLLQAARALAREKGKASAAAWAFYPLAFTQFIVGGVLASAFVKQSLHQNTTGVLGVVVLAATLMKELYHPELVRAAARKKASQLEALIRYSEDQIAEIRAKRTNESGRNSAFLSLVKIISDTLTQIDNPDALPRTQTQNPGVLSGTQIQNLDASPQTQPPKQQESGALDGAIDLALACNRTGIFTDGRAFSTGGLDGSGNAYSASQLKSTVIWKGVSFQLSPPTEPNAVSCSGQTLRLPSRKFGSLMMLATGVYGNQELQSFRVQYDDGSENLFKQSVSDWWQSRPNAGEDIAATMAYRNRSDGSAEHGMTHLYAYSFSLDRMKSLVSITLPSNGNVQILAMRATT